MSYRGGFAAAIMNSEIAYILTINNIDHDIIVPRHQCLRKVSISIIEGYYYILIEDRHLANRSILIKKRLTVAAALLMMPML